MSVIVIGSGMAGITAAAELSKKGIKVILLEAQSRVGGRLRTVRTEDGQVYDLGASWMHETLINPLFKIGVELGIPMYYDDAVSAYWTKEGPIPATDQSKMVAEDCLNNMRIDYGLGKYAKPDMSIQKYSLDFVKNWPLVSEKSKLLAPRLVQLMEMWNAISWTEIPASGAFSDGCGRNAYVIGGYDKIYNWMYDQVNWDLVDLRLDTPAVRIADKGDHYLVELANEKLDAQYVICTAPLGGLKNIEFDTKLPPKLQAAIDNGEMGALGKFFLEFEEQFWDSEIDRNVFVVDRDPTEDPPIEPGNHPVIYFTAVQKLNKKPALCAMTAPPLTQVIEANPERAFELVRPGLEQMCLPGKKVTAPTKVLCTDWSTNKWFNGSYSAFKVGETYDSAIEPFVEGAGNLRFAGEHAVFEGSGCVHGAYISGKREAANVLELLEDSRE